MRFYLFRFLYFPFISHMFMSVFVIIKWQNLCYESFSLFAFLGVAKYTKSALYKSESFAKLNLIQTSQIKILWCRNIFIIQLSIIMALYTNVIKWQNLTVRLLLGWFLEFSHHKRYLKNKKNEKIFLFYLFTFWLPINISIIDETSWPQQVSFFLYLWYVTNCIDFPPSHSCYTQSCNYICALSTHIW